MFRHFRIQNSDLSLFKGFVTSGICMVLIQTNVSNIYRELEVRLLLTEEK